MKFLVCFALILSVLTLSFAAESIGYFKDPAHPGKCVYETLVLSAGEEAKVPNECAQFSCGENSFGTIQTCGSMIPPDGCEYTDYIDINAPYSDCCERKLVC